jgi:phosphoserine phosphatase
MMLGQVRPASRTELENRLTSVIWDVHHVSRGVALVIDADRTLGPHDTGRLVGLRFGLNDRIRSVFQAKGYTEDAFCEVAGLWSEARVDHYIEEFRSVAREIDVYPTWRRTFDAAGNRVPIVVVSSGIPQAWRIRLDNLGYSHVIVIGGCHPALDEFVVCPETKAAIVEILQGAGKTVLAAGDSPIDLPMLQRADVPLFVPDSKGSPGLRAKLHLIPGVRHLPVDGSRIEGLKAFPETELVRILAEGGVPC